MNNQSEFKEFISEYLNTRRNHIKKSLLRPLSMCRRIMNKQKEFENFLMNDFAYQKELKKSLDRFSGREEYLKENLLYLKNQCLRLKFRVNNLIFSAALIIALTAVFFPSTIPSLSGIVIFLSSLMGLERHNINEYISAYEELIELAGSLK